MCKRGDLVLLVVVSLCVATAHPAAASDWRNINTGTTMVATGYADQPYCITAHTTTATAAMPRIVCVITVGPGGEGGGGEHMVSVFSDDGGHTWSKSVIIEHSPLANAYGVPIYAPKICKHGRIYCNYNWNRKNVTAMPDGTKLKRTDMLGGYFMRWSDDLGESWSSDAVPIPTTETYLDRMNEWHGKVRLMWSVAHPHEDADGSVVYQYTKIGKWLVGPPSQIFMLRSPNVLTEGNPWKVTWTQHPSGANATGIVAPSKNITAEGAVLPLPMPTHGHADPRATLLFSVFRSIAGFLGNSYSTDRGASWHTDWARYAVQAPLLGQTRFLKHPHGPLTPVWDAKRGGVFLLTYNNGHPDYAHRHVYWLVFGRISTSPNAAFPITFSEPELILYDAPTATRGPGYPDFVAGLGPDAGSWLITETQKTTARVHFVPKAFYDTLANQAANKAVAKQGLCNDTAISAGKHMLSPAPRLPMLDMGQGGGFTIELTLAANLSADTTLLDMCSAASAASVCSGIKYVAATGEVVLTLADAGGKTKAFTWATSTELKAVLAARGPHVVAFVVDGASRVVSMVVDGLFDTGYVSRPQGWVFLPAGLVAIAAGTHWDANAGAVTHLRYYDRAVMTSELVGNARAAGVAGLSE